LPLPRFVTSDFVMGGQLAATLIAEYLTEGIADVALVLAGPSMSNPGRIRSSACIYELTKRGLASRLFVDELESWSEEEAIQRITKIVTQIERTQAFSPLRVCIYCANDANCKAIDEYIESHSELHRGREYFLIGYDGTRNPDGSLILGSSKRCVGTVDVLPGSQGRSAGTFLIEEYEGRTSSHAKNALIVPRLLRRPSWK
jgi:hypothetical protein